MLSQGLREQQKLLGPLFALQCLEISGKKQGLLIPVLFVWAAVTPPVLHDYLSISSNYTVQKENHAQKETGKSNYSKLLSFVFLLNILQLAAHRAKFCSKALLKLRLWKLFAAVGLVAQREALTIFTCLARLAHIPQSTLFSARKETHVRLGCEHCLPPLHLPGMLLRPATQATSLLCRYINLMQNILNRNWDTKKMASQDII